MLILVLIKLVTECDYSSYQLRKVLYMLAYEIRIHSNFISIILILILQKYFKSLIFISFQWRTRTRKGEIPLRTMIIINALNVRRDVIAVLIAVHV